MPQRYSSPWREVFDDQVARFLRPGTSILDIGPGPRPTLDPECRPTGCRYVGLDVSPSELAKAPPGSYDETWIADAVNRVAELENRFDLVISWQVLEHVKSLKTTLQNVHVYLRPGGALVAQLSGAWSVFALVNRLIPPSLGRLALLLLLRRDPSTVFRAYYNDCSESALRRLLEGWLEVEVIPLYRGAGYFGFSRLLQRGYLLYEDAIANRNIGDLATHYVVSARKP